MDAWLGLAFILLLLGVGSPTWFRSVRAEIAERREDRRLRRKYGL
jgi:hypothetical protein